MAGLGTLPNELALSIIYHVHPDDRYQCSLINRQFHALTNPILWHSIAIPTGTRFNKLISGLTAAQSANTTSSDSTLDSWSPLGSLIRHVHLDSFLTDMQLLTFMEHTRNLEDLILTDVDEITDDSIRHLPRHCPDLKYLNMKDSMITQESIQALGDCHQLSTLFILSCTALTTDAFYSLQTCPLENVFVYTCGMVDFHGDDNGRGFSVVGQRTLHQSVLDLVSFNHLTSLVLLHCPPGFIEDLFTTCGKSSRVIWPSMTQLSLNGCKAVPEYKAIDFMRTHPRLTAFAVEPNSFTDLFLDAVVSHLPAIRSLGLSNSQLITPQGVRRLVNRCPVLEEVRLYEDQMTIHDFPEVDRAFLDEGEHHVDMLDKKAIMKIKLATYTSIAEDDLDKNES